MNRPTVTRRRARGRLIAVDGTCASSLTAAARQLVRELRVSKRSCGISAWDASGIFTELAVGEDDAPRPSARALTLLYAADLAFRLRWEIRPALEAGQSVVAVPYVQTAIAMGIAAGVPRRWLVELFRFAPKPSMCYRVAERPERGKSTTPRGGYPEFFYNALEVKGQAP